MEAFSFLLEVPSGLAYQILERVRAFSAGFLLRSRSPEHPAHVVPRTQCARAGEECARSRQPLLLATLQLLGVAATVPSSPLLSSRETIDHLGHFLWLQFAVLYTSPKGAAMAGTCTAYLKVGFRPHHARTATPSAWSPAHDVACRF